MTSAEETVMGVLVIGFIIVFCLVMVFAFIMGIVELIKWLKEKKVIK
jgi:hypothetical protein